MNNQVLCGRCGSALDPMPQPNKMDRSMISHIILWLKGYELTPAQAEHLSVIIKSCVKTASTPPNRALATKPKGETE